MSTNREPRTSRTRTRIREAAAELFLERGFLATSTDAIQQAAGIASKETLYRHYPTKEALFEDVLRSLTVESGELEGLMGRDPRVTRLADLRAELRKTIEAILTTMLEPDYIALMRVIISELPRFPALGALFRRTVPERAMGYLASLLTLGQREGIVRSDRSPEVVGRMLLGTLLTYALFDGLFLIDEPPRRPSEAVVDEIVDNLMEIVSVGGIARGS